jgi:hypothetical protein
VKLGANNQDVYAGILGLDDKVVASLKAQQVI